MKLLFCLREAWEEAYIREKLQGVDIVFLNTPLQDVPSDPSIDALSVFVGHPVDKATLEKFPNLKLITTRSTGYDHVDVAAAHERGVAVATVPSYGVNTVAEFAFALILALSRRVCEAQARVREHSFNQDDLVGFDLNGKTLGIVGTGKIGAHTAQIAKGFSMNILAHDVVENESVKALGAHYVGLPELLSGSDVVTLHVPNIPQTHHMLGAEEFAHMRRGAYLINTARGAVIDTEALLRALGDGTLAGAGLDVLENEKEITEQTKLLLAHPHVIITPHIAFDTHEAAQRILDTTIDNIKSFIDATPKNLLA